MPSVNFVGEIESAYADEAATISINWGILPGNRAWTLRSGEATGETHVATGEDGGSIPLNHPVDCFYETSSTEGWPFFIVEVWEKSEIGARNFVGCGSAWLPMKSGAQVMDINIWKPSPSDTTTEYLSEALLPTVPDLKALREVLVNPYLHSKLKTYSTGDVRVNLTVALAGFEAHGVDLC